MVVSCCVYKCTERFVKDGYFTFHCFPKDEKRRKLWEKQLRRVNFTSNKSTRICSKHFEEECYEKEQFGRKRLKPNALPTKFDFPDHLKKTVNHRKRRTEEGCLSSTVLFTSQKTFRCVGDFEEKDMESPTKARKLLVLAKCDQEISRKKIDKLRIENQFLARKISTLEELITKMKEKALISDSAVCGSVLKNSGVASGEDKKGCILLGPVVQIKEEPVDYHPTPSTDISTDAIDEKFLLSHEENIWTPTTHSPTDPMVESQFTLSVASLASAYDPEISDEEQLKKKLQTNTFSPPDQVVEPKFTLSVASLASAYNPENFDEEHLKKKLKTNTFSPPDSVVEPQFTLSVASLASAYDPEISDKKHVKKEAAN